MDSDNRGVDKRENLITRRDNFSYFSVPYVVTPHVNHLNAASQHNML